MGIDGKDPPTLIVALKSSGWIMEAAEEQFCASAGRGKGDARRARKPPTL